MSEPTEIYTAEAIDLPVNALCDRDGNLTDYGKEKLCVKALLIDEDTIFGILTGRLTLAMPVNIPPDVTIKHVCHIDERMCWSVIIGHPSFEPRRLNEYPEEIHYQLTQYQISFREACEKAHELLGRTDANSTEEEINAAYEILGRAINAEKTAH
jgi:hypothetical protein